MKFINDNFLLSNKFSEILYHEYAAQMPIIDYHCHLNPQEIAENKTFENITQAWLYGDHYKWRAMRTNGLDEKYCTGNASDKDKFMKWAECMPNLLRNPLYHWTHLELKNYFGIEKLLSKDTAEEIYEKTSELLQTSEYSVIGLMKKMKVELVVTTDDPIDTLEYHEKAKKYSPTLNVLPAWRPDKAVTINNIEEYNNYIDKLEEVANISISSYKNLIDALKKRHDFFHSTGSRLSDHGLSKFCSGKFTEKGATKAFEKVRKGNEISEQENDCLCSAILHELALMNYEKSWVQQFHFGALRNNNSKNFRCLGADTGFDSIADYPVAEALNRFLDNLEKENKLTKTILYNLNPADNEVIATTIGNFQDGKIAGKIQWGAAWWFLDQRKGMENQINTLSNLGLISRFVGMLTDSRSFLSFPRHEYFRRILCDLLGKDIAAGELPNDIKLIGKMVKDICYFNAKKYFNFPKL